MTTRRWQATGRAAIVVGVAAGFLAIARPWTVRPIQAPPSPEFNAEAYVESVWATRVLPEVERSAIPLMTALADAPAPATGSGGPSSPRSVFVTGTALVARVDTQSRVGLARLSLPASAGHAAVAIQIGPVLRGTAVRDALPFIRFTDFDNQLQFADVASALNDRVLRNVLAGVDVNALRGRTVSFLGAVTLGRPSSDGTLELVPIRLDLPRGAHGPA
jgi:predicted lipoprotein